MNENLHKAKNRTPELCVVFEIIWPTIFYSQDASLSELKISNGETLIVTEGQLPPKVLKCLGFGWRFITCDYSLFSLLLSSFVFCQGFLKLSVWLCLDPRSSSTEACFNHTDNGHTEEQMLEVAPAGETHSQSPPLCAGNMAELRSVGQVEISDEATLEDLKTQVECDGYFMCLSKAVFRPTSQLTLFNSCQTH